MKKLKFVFDLGNVMVYYKPDEYLAKLGFTGERAAAIKRATYDSEIWQDCDAGYITRDTLVEMACARNPEIADDIHAAVDNCETMLQPIPESVRALKRLSRDGYQCYFLSNTTEPAMRYLNKFDFMGMFLGGVESWAELMAKPDPAIFEKFLLRFRLEAGECVFVDDNPANVLAAKQLGFHAYRLEDVDGLYALTCRILRELEG